MNCAFKHRGWLCGVYAFFILVLSAMPADTLADNFEFFPHQDKVLHALIYGGWAGLLYWALQYKIQNHPLGWMLAIVTCVALYGVMMEALQELLVWTGRVCSRGDMLANLAGAAVGAGLADWIRRHFRGFGVDCRAGGNA